MKPILIYSKFTCGFCAAAKRLLKAKGASFTEIDLLRSPHKRAEMIARAKGRTTVPQIFIGDTHIGGYDALAALEQSGKLAALLK